MVSPGGPVKDTRPDLAREEEEEENSDTLKYQLLGPSLTKAGQDAVDQQKVRIGYELTIDDRDLVTNKTW